MRRFRVTIAGLMACVFYLGFALAALTNSERRGERATPGGVADGRPKRITPLV
jgi:hypothetical protein